MLPHKISFKQRNEAIKMMTDFSHKIRQIINTKLRKKKIIARRVNELFRFDQCQKEFH
jgi:hypothetical protein